MLNENEIVDRVNTRLLLIIQQWYEFMSNFLGSFYQINEKVFLINSWLYHNCLCACNSSSDSLRIQIRWLLCKKRSKKCCATFAVRSCRISRLVNKLSITLRRVKIKGIIRIVNICMLSIWISPTKCIVVTLLWQQREAEKNAFLAFEA